VKKPRASAQGFFQRKSPFDLGGWVLKPPRPFIPAFPSEAIWLFHVKLDGFVGNGDEAIQPDAVPGAP